MNNLDAQNEWEQTQLMKKYKSVKIYSYTSDKFSCSKNYGLMDYIILRYYDNRGIEIRYI